MRYERLETVSRRRSIFSQTSDGSPGLVPRGGLYRKRKESALDG
ncbi:hypothetical protein AvCA_30950 [Azotobacter vinelandii CA]|uniref:Uncharacterized protein n=2 Tax=Azotobacter vinelandii TaxID=354 RepID=C1DN92_AZOVD|nr:hypothetical protein Avin_30950 [Azotobacter vinelandii DJ]AGK16456.1 hypothetical protein AvCA_30950 [Azotobacter vinelandii CA]AGK21069.1 hypothetical protein AvCA6_30950 [Azotobacter vinelandii CA6]